MFLRVGNGRNVLHGASWADSLMPTDLGFVGRGCSGMPRRCEETFVYAFVVEPRKKGGRRYEERYLRRGEEGRGGERRSSKDATVLMCSGGRGRDMMGVIESGGYRHSGVEYIFEVRYWVRGWVRDWAQWIGIQKHRQHLRLP
jgi:hypothetical protein